MNCPEAKHTKNLDSAYQASAQSLLQTDKDLYRLCLYENNDQKRQSYFTFFAFLTEIEKISFIASEPAIAVVRLKWWYDELQRREAQPNDPPHILCLKSEIIDQHLDLTALLELIDLIQDEKSQHKSRDAKDIEKYCKNKGALIARALKMNEADSLFSYLAFVRLAKNNKAITIPDIIDFDSLKKNFFYYKTKNYIDIMINKMNKNKKLELSILDLIKLHFC